MVNLKKRPRKEPEIPTSSMSDIAFLLLVFFLVTTTIDVDTGLGITLPEFIEDQELVPVSKDRMAALLVNENGDVLLDGNVIAIPQIAKNLKERIAGKIDLPANKKLIVSIKTDRKTVYNKYIQTLDQVKLAFAEVRDEYSLRTYGNKYNELDEVNGKDVREKIPVIISIAEPEVVKK